MKLNLEVRDEQRKAGAISKIKTVDGVHNITDFRGKEIAIKVYYTDKESLARKVRLIESICESQELALWNTPFPWPDVQMNHLDWRIIDALREDAWRDLKDVAKSLNVSVRTVQRRLSEMKEGKAVYLSRPPNIDAVGGLMCHFLLFWSDRDKKRVADKAIYSTFRKLGWADTSSEQFSTYGISCENFSEADKVMNKLKVIDGVLSVRMRIVKEIIILQDWLKVQIAMQLQSATF